MGNPTSIMITRLHLQLTMCFLSICFSFFQSLFTSIHLADTIRHFHFSPPLDGLRYCCAHTPGVVNIPGFLAEKCLPSTLIKATLHFNSCLHQACRIIICAPQTNGKAESQATFLFRLMMCSIQSRTWEPCRSYVKYAMETQSQR